MGHLRFQVKTSMFSKIQDDFFRYQLLSYGHKSTQLDKSVLYRKLT